MIAALLLALAVLASSGAFAGSAATAARAHGTGHAHGFERFLQRYEAANSAFVNGEPSPWLSITAEQDPASIFGRFGGLGEAGVATVRQRYLLAASAFRPSGTQVGFEYLVKDVRGRLAYTVAIERARPVRGTERATAAHPAGHDDLPLREGSLEDRPPARGHDGRSAASSTVEVTDFVPRRSGPTGPTANRKVEVAA